ncbi:MAG: hypothetical protein ACXWC4_12755 [Telluria sp.]
MRSMTIARTGVLACVLAAGAAVSAQQFDDSTVAPAVAEQQKQEIRHGDPARWHKPDTSMQARLANLRKEINAAYAEAKRACAGQPKGERSSCLDDARTTYRNDLSNARDLATAPAPQLGASERGSATQSGQ